MPIGQKLSKRAELEQIIARGESVMWNGRVISRMQDLPSEADLAESPEDRAAVIAALDSQIGALQAQRDKLAAAHQSPEISPPAKKEASEQGASEPKKAK